MPGTDQRVLIENQLESSDHGHLGQREAFWNRYLERHPGVFKPSRGSNVWVPMLPDGSVFLSIYLAARDSGMFLRGGFGADPNVVAAVMDERRNRLDEALGEGLGATASATEGHYHVTSKVVVWRDESKWDELIDWMESMRTRYGEVFRGIERQTGEGPAAAPPADSQRRG